MCNSIIMKIIGIAIYCRENIYTLSYSELNHLPNSQRYLIPKNAIDSLIILYRSGLV